MYVAPQALGPSGSGKSSLEDIRNLWTTASLSQSQLNLPLSDVCEDSHVERSSLGRKTRQWYNQKAGHHSDVAWEKSVARDKAHFKQEKQDDRSLLELEQRRGRSQGSHLKGDDSNPDTGQCGLTGLWESKGQGAGQDPNFCCCNLGNSRIQISRVPWEGRLG